MKSLAQVSEPEKFKSLAELRTSLISCVLSSPPPAFLPCSPAPGWAVSPVLWEGFKDQSGVPRRQAVAGGLVAERKG